ncbi:MAG: hypothetical protein M3R04_00870 [bacterium]|nr:hypothetical protein [bacterium]
MREIELTAIAWSLVGYVGLQVLLNVLSMLRHSRAKNKPLNILVSAFQANVLNALYFIALAIGLRISGLIETREPPAGLWLHALIGVPLGFPLWYLLTQARKLGLALFGRSDLALAEEAIVRHAPTPRLQSWGVMNLIVIQPLGHELFMRGLFLPVVVRHMGWGWGIAATLLVELLLRLNIVWVYQTLVYALAMLGLFYYSGAALVGLTAAMTAGAIQAAVLLKQRQLAEVPDVS